MIKSESIDQLAAALSRFQGQVKDPVKDQQAHKFKYADLCQILEIARPLLAENKLSVMQLPGSANNKVTVETLLMHESGQWISSTIEMAIEDNKSINMAQSVGSVISYARRYSMAAVLGISQTDLDANLIKEEEENRARPTFVKSAPRPVAAAIPKQVMRVNAEQREELYTDLEKLAPAEKLSAWCADEGVQSFRELPLDKVQKAVDKLRQVDILRQNGAH